MFKKRSHFSRNAALMPMLGFRVHLISRSKGFACLQSWPIETDWSLTPFFILIEETKEQNFIEKRSKKLIILDLESRHRHPLHYNLPAPCQDQNHHGVILPCIVQALFL